jgi:predicted acylesterase/phospholipase RssA
MYKYIVFSGGASKGLAYIGVLKYFEEHPELIKDIYEYVGCSVGAFSALLMILGYTSETLINIFNNYNLEFLKNLKISNFLSVYGLDNGNKLESFIKVFIKKKFDSDLITLQELYEKTQKKLITVTTNVNTKKTEYISKDTYPNMPVYLAVQMSMNIPLLFKPIEYNDSLYVDGCLTCNFPVNYYTNKEKIECDKILAFVFHQQKDTDLTIKSFEDYIYNIIKCSFSTIQNISRDNAENKKCNVIEIDHCIKSNFQFEVSLETKNNLYLSGYNSIKKFMETKTQAMTKTL